MTLLNSEMIRRMLTAVLLSCCCLLGWAQGNVHEQSADYEWPTDKAVVEKLRQWKDLKFGVLLHWGIYSVPGIVESWSICNEGWIERDTTQSFQQYQDWYFALADKFCPRQFDPHQWASVMSDAGMRYMIFTTKHHDGFCMYDSHETDYTIARHAFRDDDCRDVLQHVLGAFREKQFMIGTYFSKPDWHSQYYWWDVYPNKGRNVNYPIEKYPWRWEQFCKFTYRQLEEILSRYGSVDILWLDGGWVCTENNQDIHMPQIAQMARRHQPGLLIVDRTIRGPYENYQTPERTIPERQLDYPWESCIPLSDDWGYVPRPRWKSAQQVVNTLMEIVAKGGNMVLGVGPTPEGIIEPGAVERLQAIGQWLRANGKAIYGTVTTSHYHEGNLWFTASKDGRRLYALYAHEEGTPIPAEVSWTGNEPHKRVRMLGSGRTLKYRTRNGRTVVDLGRQKPKGSFAIVIE